jgi:hypothetical protein
MAFSFFNSKASNCQRCRNYEGTGDSCRMGFDMQKSQSCPAFSRKQY